jgi:hypothetical protein
MIYRAAFRIAAKFVALLTALLNFYCKDVL